MAFFNKRLNNKKLNNLKIFLSNCNNDPKNIIQIRKQGRYKQNYPPQFNR